VQGFAWS